MRAITSIVEIQSQVRDARSRGKSLALVPTMGALHEGHFALIRQAKHQCDTVVLSIFVNPKQFTSPEDLEHYPRNLERDLELLEPFNVDAVFVPAEKEMYPEGFATAIEPGRVASMFEGESRPGHFAGVATVVLKLFNIIKPDIAYFGQKDFQQTLVVRRLVEDMNLDVRLVVCPIAREPDGLALSSRNSRLSPEERKAATVLHRSLTQVEGLAQSGESQTAKLVHAMREVIAAEPLARLDYAAVVEPTALRPVERVTAGCVALVAARIGQVRLIDNLILGPPGASPETLLQLALTAQPVLDAGGMVPGFETEAVRLKIAACRQCAALSSIVLPPREYLAGYIRTLYPDRSLPRVAVIGRDAPLSPDNFLYHLPEKQNRFVRGLFDLIGVASITEFRQRFVLTDAIRCHSTSPHLPGKALAYCSEHLRAELKLFPNLDTFVVLGDDAYLQFQQHLVERNSHEIRPFEDLLRAEGWAMEKVRIPALGKKSFRAFYCYHPTFGYKRSPSIAPMLA